MSAEKIAQLQSLIGRGKTVACAEILAVYWDEETTNYYAITNYSELLPHGNCPLSPIEPRLTGQKFHSFEINGDLRTETINFVFDNIDKGISNKFQTYGEGVRCELFYYWADVDLLVSSFWGQLSRPDNADYSKLFVSAKNGFYASEALLPGRNRPKECAFTYGGHFTTLAPLETNGCPYDRHLGGSNGLLVGGLPIPTCARLSEADCIEHFGHALNYGGYKSNVQSVITSSTGYSAVSKGSTSALKDTIRVIFGTKKVRQPQQLFFRREIGAQNPDHDWINGIFEVGEGPVQSIFNVKLAGTNTPVSSQHINIRLGTRAQGRTSYAPDVPNYSYTAHLMARYGWINASSISAEQYQIELDCAGYNRVKVYTDISTSSRTYTTDRVWCLLECYTNQRFGRRYSHERFDIEAFITASVWSKKAVRFTTPKGDIFDHVRSTFNAVCDGRVSAETITDICRSGRISVPFQHNGKYTIEPLRKWSDDELANAKVFTDTGDGKNIEFADGQPSLRISQIPNDQLVNKVVVTFEDAAFEHQERPLTVDDPNQQVLAGKARGQDSFHEIPANYNAFGITSQGEAIKFAQSLLDFGEFDKGGIKNNCTVMFSAKYEQCLDLKKYQVIKIESAELDGVGYRNPLTDVFTQFQYFRVMSVKKDANNICALTCQAYNHVAFAAFEVEWADVPTPPVEPTEPQQPPIEPQIPCAPIPVLTYNDDEGLLTITIEPC